MLAEKGTEISSEETFPITLKSAEGQELTDRMRIRIVLLPDFGADGNKDRKISQRGQGFYVLRNNREIAGGQRLDLFTRHNDLNRFYQRFVLESKDDQTLRTFIDFLVYSLATAELITLNEDNFETIQTIKSVMSSNLRSLLS
jgi:hypothetical protein